MLTLQPAHEMAQALRNRLRLVCERIEIAGSIRRSARIVRDIQLVAIPTLARNLWDEPDESVLDRYLAEFCQETNWYLTLNGPRYKVLANDVRGIHLDLYLCRPDNFGLIFLLRTGPAPFSRMLVTPQSVVNKDGRVGWLPAGHRVAGGQLWHGDLTLDVPEESTLFAVCDRPYVHPWDRH